MSEGFTKATLLRIFVGEADTTSGMAFFEAVVQLARAEGLSGATVLRGIESLGQDGTTHTARLLRLSEDLPVVVEIVDTPETIERFIPKLDELFINATCGGLITTEEIMMRKYRSTTARN